MLKPTEDRLDYGQILAPPAGYECEFAVGTTYSLDLEAMLGVPLALFLADEMDGTLLENPISVLEGLRKSADKMAIFCEAGQIKVPDNGLPVFALLESSIFQVALKNERTFHPKVWLIKYTSDDGKALYRFIVLSRNLTFDRSWDLAVVLEGEANGRKTLKNTALIDFLQFLKGWTFGSGRKRQINDLANELYYVHFKTSDKRYADFEFLPLGIDDYGQSATGLFETYHDLLVFSPFLSRKTVERLDGLSLKNSHQTLITRRTEVPKLTDDLLKHFDCYCLKDLVVDGEEAISESNGQNDDIRKQDIHGKLYFKTKDSRHTLFVGSANCSESAFNGNVEFLISLNYEKWGFRIAQVIDELFGRNEKDYNEQQNPFEKIESIPAEVEAEIDEKEHLQKAIKRLCRSRSKAVVADNVLLSILEQSAQKDGETDIWRHHAADMPALYEHMLQAAAYSPEKLAEIEAVIRKVNDHDIVPPDFERLYQVFRAANRRMKQ